MHAVTSWSDRLLRAGGARAPVPGVTRKAAHLCCALSELALSTYAAVGGSRYRAEVAEAAATLALLTKLDDQIIDSAPFHGGRSTDRDTLRRRTTETLAPTLAALREPVDDRRPRVALATELGAQLRRLSAHPDRLEDLLRLCAHGWAVQVDAVAVFTAHPASVPEPEVARVTRTISRDWLLMISLIGTLPADAQRTLTGDELAAFWEWGRWIQSADALADLEKDLADGHVCTLPGKRAWERAGETYLTAADRRVGEVYRLFAELGIDRDLLPADLSSLHRRMAGLGELPGLLHWIHSFLTWRYTVHPLSRTRQLPAHTPWAEDHARYLEVVCSER